MAFETKALLAAMAQYAIATLNKGMYDFVVSIANTENLAMPPYPANTDEEKAAK